MRDEKIYASVSHRLSSSIIPLTDLEPHSFIGRAEGSRVGIVGDHGRDAGLD